MPLGVYICVILAESLTRILRYVRKQLSQPLFNLWGGFESLVVWTCWTIALTYSYWFRPARPQGRRMVEKQFSLVGARLSIQKASYLICAYRDLAAIHRRAEANILYYKIMGMI